MIKYNNSNINDWNFDTSNIIKVYRNNAVVYYKVEASGSTPTYKVCYAVVDNITQYSETEFVDVYDKTTNKWYKLNNLNQYEVYGVYGKGRSITYYDGKLTIDDGYEYQYSNGSWNNVGEVSVVGLSDDFIIPFEDATTKTLCVNNWGGNVVTGEITYGEAKAVTSLGSVFARNTAITSFNELGYFHGLTTLQNGEFAGCTNLTDVVIPSNIIAIGYNSASRAPFSGCTNLSGLTILSGEETLTMALFSCNNSYYMYSNNSSTPFVFPNRPMTFESSTFGYCDSLMYAYFQPSTPPSNLANSDINMSNKIKNTFCPVDSLSAYQTALSGKGKTITEYDFETDSLGLLDKEKEWLEKTTTFATYPLYYDEKPTPPNNLTFSSMTEANEYAYNNCVYDGMTATIGRDGYYFDSGDEDGWVYSPYVPLEYIETVINSNNSGLQLPNLSEYGYVYELTCLTNNYNLNPNLLGTKTKSEPRCGYEFGLCYYDTLGVFVDMGTRISSNILIGSKTVIRCGQTNASDHTYYMLQVGTSTKYANVGSFCLSNFKLLVGDLAYTSQTDDTPINTTSKIQLRIYGLKIWSDYGETLIADYIPCLDGNSSPNLYDKVSGRFATPMGALTAGPNV